MTRLLIGGYSGDKGAGTGITVLDGSRVLATIPADSPSWLARHPVLPVVYAVAEIDEGRVHAWRLADGVPAEPLGTGDTGGSEPAHLTVDPSGRFLVTANYSGGSLSVHRLGPDGSIGERTDLVRHAAHGEHPRQDTAHPHMVRAVGDDLLVSDLGGDAIYRYRLTPDGQLAPDSVIAAPPASGPRHVLPVGDRYYVTAELSGQILVYDATLGLVGSVAASAAAGPNQPSELVSDGRYLYVANRGPNTISVFDITAGGSGGSSPQDSTSGGSGGSSPQDSTAGGSGGSSPQDSTAGGSGGSSPQDSTAEGPGGSSPRDSAAELPRYVTEVAAGDWPRHIALDGDTLYVANERSHELMRMRVDPATGIPERAETIEVPSPTLVLL